MPQETKAMSVLAASPTLPGWTVDLTNDQFTFEVLEKAFDYRGDVSLTLRDARVITGYIFDRRRGHGLDDSSVRLMASGSDDKITIAYTDIRHIAFSDRDPAAGKSFETWVKKYVEKKLAGEKASIESESLD
jgi:hypothetical protein